MSIVTPFPGPHFALLFIRPITPVLLLDYFPGKEEGDTGVRNPQVRFVASGFRKFFLSSCR